ncbi:MAG TPA: helix-turn-helix transcriptional regulator [Bacillales bacterium]|nr:helix-turn-helix transcriptional regulator [Bacillales bacterium]
MNVSKREYIIQCKLGGILNERGLTQHAMADLCGVKQGSISRIINGNKRYHYEHLIRIADALELTVPDLFEIERKDEK